MPCLIRVRPMVALAAALALTHPAPGQQPVPRKDDVKTLVVDPAPAPRPTYRYRLLPPESERTRGDAAPVYLRIAQEEHSDRIRAISEQYFAWINKPAADFPAAEARKLVDEWRGKTEQLAFGARRWTCDWSYTLPEQRERIFEVILPDAQQMRTWARLLELKARTEIIENNYDEAIRTIETGLGFARHVGEGPFLINGLVGIGMAHGMIAQAEELVTRPGSPNLYWALTALPRPLVDLRAAADLELRFGEKVAPELADLDRPRTDAEWSTLLIRLVDRLNGLAKGYLSAQFTGESPPPPLDAAGFRARYLPEAKRALEGQPAPAGPMTDDRAVVLLVASRFRELRDLFFRASYLPFPESAGAMAEAEERMRTEKDGPAGILARLMPSVSAAIQSEVKLDRRIAALRVVEAIRMHAAAKGRKLPATLAEVTVVPIPSDPATGKPFAYSVEGEAASLTASHDRLTPPWIDYRVTIRK